MITAAELTTELDLNRFFDEGGFKYDLEKGTIHNPGQTRVLWLSADTVRGIYLALHEEAGPAWKLILKNCGRFWGKKVAQNLDRELSLLAQTRQADLAVPVYLQLVEAYFRQHGWGVLELDLEDAVAHGVIEARLHHSFFAEVLDEVNEPVDQLIAGILEALFSHISGQPVGCLEIASERTGADCGCFILSGEERIFDLEELVEAQAAPEDIRAKLKSA